MLPTTPSVSLEPKEEKPSEPEQIDLDEGAIYDLLSNERRRVCLKILAASEGTLCVKELSERVAKQVSEEGTDGDEIYNSVYISLCQTHLPKLNDEDIVSYDSNSKTVERGAEFDRIDRQWLSDGQTVETARPIQLQTVAASIATLLYLALVLLGAQELSAIFLPVLSVVHLAIIGFAAFRRLSR